MCDESLKDKLIGFVSLFTCVKYQDHPENPEMSYAFLCLLCSI